MRGSARFVRNYWFPLLSMLAAIGVAALAPFVVISYNRTGKQAESGAVARKTQCRVLPIATKVYTDAHRRGVITSKDLEVYRGVFALCPKRKK